VVVAGARWIRSEPKWPGQDRGCIAKSAVEK
jgi:hypothetical protein